MDHFKIDQKLLESIMARPEGEGLYPFFEEVTRVVDLITEEVNLPICGSSDQSGRDHHGDQPHLTEKEILETVAKNVVEYLGAESREPTNIRSWEGGDDLFWILSSSDGGS